MALHPKLQEFLTQINQSAYKPFAQMSIAEMRQATKNFSVFQGEGEEIYKTMSKYLSAKDHEYLIKLYIPSAEKDLPVLLFFHSGGFVKGDVEYCDTVCRKLANGSHAIVVSVNYRLAPEHPFPAATHDAYHALCFVHDHIAEFGGNPHMIALVGESSGGNLAVVTALMSYHKKGPPICFQVLIYPHLDYTYSFPSHQLFGSGYFLTEEALEFYAQCYLPKDMSRSSEWVSPYFTPHYQHLPPTCMITAEYDPLRDEGEAFARNLKKAGVAVTYHCFPGMIHGFLSMGALVEDGRQALHMICDKLKVVFKKGGYKQSA